MHKFIISSFALCGLLGFVACTTEEAEEPTTTSTTSTTDNTGGSGGSTTSQGGGTTSAGGMGGSAQGGMGGGTTAITAVCAGLAATPDDTCVTVGQGLADCNPITGATSGTVCGDGDNGEAASATACDSAGVADYECFDPGTAVCGASCSTADTPCEAGYTCTDKDAFMGMAIHDNPVCARFCCADADCGGGVCADIGHSNGLGVCLSAAP